MKPISYGKQYITDEDINYVVEALKSDLITQGPKVVEFEKALSDYHNCRYAVVFSNGTAALHGSYYASGINKGDEFITTPMTFAATANAGVYLGAVPVFCDIDLNTGNIDIDLISEKVTSKTKVITPVSYAGNPVNIKKIRDMFPDMTIIHDAAHAIGAVYEGANICDYADMAVVSFHPVKHITTAEGGVVLTNNREYYEKLILFRNHGIQRNADKMINCDGPWYYEMQELGFNYRLSDIQCALGISQLKRADWSINLRKEIAKKYNEAFCNSNKISVIENNLGKNSRHSYHLYPVLTKEGTSRRNLFDYLRNNNVFVQVHYIPLNYMPYYQNNFGFKKGDFPNAEYFYNHEISLPIYPTLKDDEQNYVIELINNFESD